jgi:hypothetical protein
LKGLSATLHAYRLKTITNSTPPHWYYHFAGNKESISFIEASNIEQKVIRKKKKIEQLDRIATQTQPRPSNSIPIPNQFKQINPVAQTSSQPPLQLISEAHLPLNQTEQNLRTNATAHKRHPASANVGPLRRVGHDELTKSIADVRKQGRPRN